MTTATLTLADFLLARYDEDEAAAKSATVEGVYPHFGDTAAEEVLEMARSEGCSELGIAHHSRHDPARVLADVAAKRAIVESCRSDHEDAMASRDDTTSLATEVLRALAVPYADHEDFREEWSA